MRLSSRTSNALNALVWSEQKRFKQTSEKSALMVGSQERVPDGGTSNRKGPMAINVEPVGRYCK